MKVIISLALIIVGATSDINDKTKKLDDWFTEMQARHPKGVQGDPFGKQINYLHTNKWRIEGAIDLYNNRAKQLNFADAMILIYGGGLKSLLESDKANTWKQMILALSDSYHESMSGNMNCFLVELEKFTPRSGVLSNFDSENIEIDEGVCNEVIDNAGLSNHIANIENQYGSLNELTCGAVNENSIKKFLLEVIALSSEGVTENKGSFANMLGRNAKKILESSFDCVLKRMKESGPEWKNPTMASLTATEATTQNTRSQQNRNNNRDTGNQGSSNVASQPQKETVYYNGNVYDVHENGGAKWIAVNRQWVRVY